MPITMPSEADYAAKKARYDKAYERGHPLIDDIKYDAFIRRFKKAHPKAKTLKDVGSDEGKGEREPLPIVVGSLDLCRPDEVAKWMKGVEKVTGPQTGWIFEPKFDGVSITLHYQSRKLDKAWSRGKIIDGKSMGFDVTSRVKYAEGIPARLRDVPTIDTEDEYLVRGELIMHRALFNKFYLDKPDDKGKARKNARNTVAGWVNSDNPKPADIRRCTFIALHLFRKVKGVWRRPSNAHREWVLLTLLGFTSAMNPVRYSEGHYNLRKLVKEGHRGLKTVLPVHEMGGAIDGNLAYIDHLPTEAEVLERVRAIHAAVDIRCDGIVVQPIENKKYQDKGEQVASHPAFMRAIKLAPSQQFTLEGVVKSVEWSISQRGLLKPVIILRRALNFEGVDVNRCTGINAKFILANSIEPGRRIKLIRSGDTIPRLMQIFKQGKWIDVK